MNITLKNCTDILSAGQAAYLFCRDYGKNDKIRNCFYANTNESFSTNVRKTKSGNLIVTQIRVELDWAD